MANSTCEDSHNEHYSNSQNQAVNYNDPYYLSFGDNPRQQLGTMLLSGDNFINWNRSVKMALGAKNKLVFIDGSLPKPSENSHDYNKWIRNDYMIQHDNMSIAEYFGKMKSVWDKLQVLEGNIVCTCNAMTKCTCNLLKKDIDAQETKKLIQFICGLNKQYDSIKTNLLSMEPLPTVLKAYHILQQIEKQNTLNLNNSKTEISALYSQKSGQSSGYNQGSYGRGQGFKKDFRKSKIDLICYHCKGKGHITDQCFKLLGYPEWYTNMKNKTAGNPRMANAVIDNSESSGDNCLSGDSNSAGPQYDTKLVSAVYQEVLKMMQNQQSFSPLSDHQHASVNFAGPSE